MTELEEFYDREYNPRLRIVDFADYFGRWAMMARITREELPCRPNLSYGSSPAETLDFFPATGAGPHPLIVFVHGGFWRALDKSDFSWIARIYVASGVSVAVCNYGLAPTVPVRTIVAQMRRACTWLYLNAGPLAVDANSMVWIGHSAGAHLVTMMLTTDWPSHDPRLPRRLFRSAFAVSGLFDLEPLTHAPFLKDVIALSERDIDELSPARLNPVDPAPLLLALGALESSEFHRQTQALAAAWKGPAIASAFTVSERHHLSICDALGSRGNPLSDAVLASCLL